MQAPPSNQENTRSGAPADDISRQAGQHDPNARHEDRQPNGRSGDDGHGGHDGKQQPEHDGHGHGEENPIPDNLPKPSGFKVALIAIVFVLLLCGLVVVGWVPYHNRQKQAEADANARVSSTPVVGVVMPISSNEPQDLFLPSDVRANQETSIYPRTNGYLKKWYVDIQDHVEAGKLLAEIDTPEVDAQLDASKAALEQAKANIVKSQTDVDLALRTLQRYQDAQQITKGSVTDQEIDEKRAAADQAAAALVQAKATVVAAEADVKRLSVLQSFEKITAPFSGTITARNYDVGALLSASDTAPGRQMFSIAQTDTLRVFVNVPQSYATQVQIGQPAYLLVRNYPGREFVGTVTRSGGSLDPTTRTLSLEIHFPNHDATLYAGMYGTVRLGILGTQAKITIPTSALIFNAKGLQVATVRDNKIHIQNVNVGRDMGTAIEVNGGLSHDDLVVTNPNEQLAEGVSVSVQKPQPPAGPQPGATRASAN